MTDQEGVIKYKLNHNNTPLDRHISLSEINAWRTILFKLKLIGQIEGKYGGYGFGNISQRIAQSTSKKRQFIISGTQTGSLESLSTHHYCIVLEALPNKNSIKSAGETKPSSEALTHASVYEQNTSIQSVIHIHCPEIWNHTDKLKLPYTSADIPYGTPEMAKEVKRLLRTSGTEPTGIFSMLGHEDGIVAYSDSMEKAACLIIRSFSKAIELEPK